MTPKTQTKKAVPENNGRVLDLDELFGMARPIVVVWKTRKYQLRRPTALSPDEIVRNERLRVRWAELQDRITDGEALETSSDMAGEIEEVTKDMISILCPELAKVDLPFVMQVQVLQYYANEVAPEAAPVDSEKKVFPGVISSPG
jgi:hypothetical protein